jgi:hypothetical protein
VLFVQPEVRSFVLEETKQNSCLRGEAKESIWPLEFLWNKLNKKPPVFSSVFQIVNHKQFKGFSLAIIQIILLKVHSIVSTTFLSEFGNKYFLNFTKEVQR